VPVGGAKKMKTTTTFNLTMSEVNAVLKTTEVLSAYDTDFIKEITLSKIDKIRMFLGGKKTGVKHFSRNGIEWEARFELSKEGLSLEFSGEIDEIYLVEAMGVYQDAIKVTVPAIAALVGSVIAMKPSVEAASRRIDEKVGE
jgi:hypothetical protein